MRRKIILKIEKLTRLIVIFKLKCHYFIHWYKKQFILKFLFL